MRRRLSLPRVVPRIDEADYAGVLDRLREGLLDVDRQLHREETLQVDGVEYVEVNDRPRPRRRNFTVTHPRTLLEIQQKLDDELRKLAVRKQ